MGLRRALFRSMDALSRRQKRILMGAADIAALAASIYLAYALRLGKPVPPVGHLWWLFVALPILSIPVFHAFGLYRMIVRHMGPHVAGSVIKAVSVSTLILAVVALFGGERGLPRSVVILYWCISLLAVGGMRFAVRSWLQTQGRRGQRREPVVIYGAGAAGRQSAAALLQGNEYRPVAFVDDDASLQGSEIHGIRVYSPDALGKVAGANDVELVLLAMPSVRRGQRRAIIERLEPLPLHIKTLPGLADLVSGSARVDEFRNVDIEDLLGRDPVAPQQELLDRCVRGKVVLVTGAGGSIGSELCRQILKLGPSQLLLLDASEYALYQIDSELTRRAALQGRDVKIDAFLGSVLDADRLQRIMHVGGVDTVYHAAAYKHVPLVEQNMIEGVRNNVLGTYRCAEAAIASGVQSFVLISTDKAVRPTNVMGASKRLAELVLQGLALRQSKTRFTMVRFGNVLGSSGSVVPLFREQIAQGGPVTVTHPEVVRYFMTIPEAAELVIQAGSMGQGGDVFVLNMGQPVKIVDLARRMIHLMGLTARDQDTPDGDVAIEFTGLRPGEKLYEELLIGDSVSATQHPMIMRAEEDRIAWRQVAEMLDKIQQACEAYG
ncbi:MAG TPA: nucleoside-diphosphate sugar epimerase/dehydratase, partial [Gammaproteobacteria bacterium]|nr:nucleoside-diphosphate sugar epimerase/dehydratase [Gammaproteobacteria bacterium]